MEMIRVLKDDGMTIVYCFGKVNVVVDALGWKTVCIGSLPLVHVGECPLAMDINS